MEKKIKIVNWETGFLHHRIVTAVETVEFVSDGTSYIGLRGRWCNIIVLNVHALSKEKSDVSRDSFYGRLEQVFHHFPKYNITFLFEILIKNWGERLFSKRQLGIKVYVRKIMVMALE